MIEKKYFKTKDYVKVKFTLAAEAKKVEILGLIVNVLQSFWPATGLNYCQNRI